MGEFSVGATMESCVEIADPGMVVDFTYGVHREYSSTFCSTSGKQRSPAGEVGNGPLKVGFRCSFATLGHGYR